MALSVLTVYEVNGSATSGNVNGAGFNPSNANMLTDLTTDANTANTSAPVVSSASYNFAAGDVNNWLYVKSGTNWTPGWYKIASVASNKATLTAGVGTAVQTDSTQGNPSPRYITNTVAGCATVGTPTNGTFTIDYSQATAAIVNGVADFNAVGASTTLTSATAGFTPVMVGNLFCQTTTGTGAFGVTGRYEIATYVNATTVTLDRTPNSGTASVNTTGYVGGAASLNSSTANIGSDAFFENGSGTNGTGASRFFIKSGTISTGQSVSIAAVGGTKAPVAIEGYQTIRGDAPTGTNRPTLDGATLAFAPGQNWDIYNIIFTSTNGTAFTAGGASKYVNCKFINPSTTAARVAITLPNTSNLFIGCEFISYRGDALNFGTSSPEFYGCYFHDSDKLINITTNAVPVIKESLFVNAVTNAYITAGATAGFLLSKNTFYGAENKLGTAISCATGPVFMRLIDNILYGYTTAVTMVDTQTIGYDDYNDYFNNTTDVSNWQKGVHDLAVDPQFVSVTQITGSGASSATNVLTDATKDFTALGVTTNDFVHVVSMTGTGSTNNTIYAITNVGTTTLTLSSNLTSSGAGAAIVYQLTIGRNFSIGTNLKAMGFPGAFQGTGLNTTGYTDIGAVQRQEAGGSGGTPWAGWW